MKAIFGLCFVMAGLMATSGFAQFSAEVPVGDEAILAAVGSTITCEYEKQGGCKVCQDQKDVNCQSRGKEAACSIDRDDKGVKKCNCSCTDPIAYEEPLSSTLAD